MGRDGSHTSWASLVIEAALLERSEWVARLISGPFQRRDKPKQPFRVRKSFSCSKAGSARLYATAHGMYQVEINGRVVGDELLAPGWQSYNNRLHYQTYDVTSYLVDGDNVVGAYIAEGWFAGRLGRPGASNIWGDRLSFLGQLEVDGQVVCASDSSWEWLGGPILGAEIYNGEIFDATLDDPSWSTTTSSATTNGLVQDVGFPFCRAHCSRRCPGETDHGDSGQGAHQHAESKEGTGFRLEPCWLVEDTGRYTWKERRYSCGQARGSPRAW